MSALTARSEPIVPAPSPASDLTLRDQLAGLHAILALSLLMTERGDEDDIVYLATTAVPSLGHCRIVGAYLLGLGWRATGGPCTRPGVRAEVQTQLARLHRGSGPLTVAGESWGWAVALASFDDHLGFLVVAADGRPTAAELFLLRVLAQQTGIALANARLHARQHRTAAELRTINTALTETVAALERKTAIHERLTEVSVAGEGQQGIARALHELTGFPVAVEDRHGNVLAWAGYEPDRAHRKIPAARRERTLIRATAAGRPIRADGRLVVVARPRDDALGVLALLDPDGVAGEQETVALEHGATVLAMELVRLRSLADTRLRLGRDIVAELISGAGEAAALGMARAMGYDLERPHRVLVIDGPGSGADALAHAVRHAAAETRVGLLLMPRAGTVVLLAPVPPGGEPDWERFRRAVRAEPGGARCRVGVGGVGHRPGDLARSHREAELALRLHGEAGTPDRAVVYDDMGVYQLLSEVPDAAGVERFVRRWLGSLLDYDARRGTELVGTLSRFLECGGHYDVTARELALGRSTLRYRLQRIREISAHDPSDPDTRFNLHLACRAWCTLRALRDGDAR